mmetsp:Transcript_43011/g.31405  ORF Transcript_43011/g.31405 Transcript_43011/m.31405 type:complete len:160 (-) Transcript_43011:856-1335(-)
MGYVKAEDRPNERIHSSELFDMMAGTSAGAFIAAALAASSDGSTPMYYGKDVYHFYEKYGSEVFKVTEIPLWRLIGGTLGIGVLIATLGYLLASCCCVDSSSLDDIRNVKPRLRASKGDAKKDKEISEETLSTITAALTKMKINPENHIKAKRSDINYQ